MNRRHGINPYGKARFYLHLTSHSCLRVISQLFMRKPFLSQTGENATTPPWQDGDTARLSDWMH